LLHGAERDGRSMLDMWQHLGRDMRIVLIAPNALGKGWSPDTEGDAFLKQVLDEAAKIYAFDPARVYLFGHSAGANHALRLANRTKGPWRAVAKRRFQRTLRGRDGGLS
jgi:pimeloyl-ACP methyl ester carboxylesterase